MRWRYGNAFKITFQVLMGKYLSAGGIYIKFDLINVMLNFLAAVPRFKVGQNKLFVHTYGFNRDIQQVAQDKIQNTVAYLVAAFGLQCFVQQKVINIGV